MDGWMYKEELSSHIPALATCWGKCFCTAISWLMLARLVAVGVPAGNRSMDRNTRRFQRMFKP